MKKLTLFLWAVVLASGCGNKTGQTASNADSTVVDEGQIDSLTIKEAVISQVNAVYDYLDEMRQNDQEGMPSMDDRFATREWQMVRKEVEAIDRECECGGFFDFGDNGPLDPWVYDCYEGRASANDIQVSLLPDGTADVRFLVKDAVTIEGVPMRWLMKVEDGEWRVADIFFPKDNDFDILQGMRDYVEYSKTASSDVTSMSEKAGRQPNGLFRPAAYINVDGPSYI